MYEYRAFGEQLKKLGEGDAKYTYVGKELDGDTNLYYFNARFYDPTIGRFINVDPIQDGTNWYVYCSNNPLSFVDPTGLSARKIWTGISRGFNVAGIVIGAVGLGVSLIALGIVMIATGIAAPLGVASIVVGAASLIAGIGSLTSSEITNHYQDKYTDLLEGKNNVRNEKDKWTEYKHKFEIENEKVKYNENRAKNDFFIKAKNDVLQNGNKSFFNQDVSSIKNGNVVFKNEESMWKNYKKNLAKSIEYADQQIETFDNILKDIDKEIEKQK